MKDSILRETLNYYEDVTSVYEATGYRKTYELNAFWSRENMQSMTKILNNSKTAREAVHSVQRTWMFSVNVSNPVKKRAVDWLLDEQAKRGIDIFSMSEAIAESPFSEPQNNVVRKNRILTPDFLRAVNVVCELKKYCQFEKPKLRIIELGAGCGHLARAIRLSAPKSLSYVIVDIPETLCFSYMFLKLNFPQSKSIFITHEKQLQGLSVDDFDYIFVPTKFAEGILENEFDIFINTASFGEMKNSVLHYWMDFIQNKLIAKYIFTLNRYLNTIRTDGSMDWRLDENECSLLYGPGLEILNWELEPPFTRCPYIDTIIARYVEIVARKTKTASHQENKKKAAALLSEVIDQDWVRLEKTFDEVMTSRDNILVNDMTMDGTLFKLWESIRLCPDENNLALILKYLEILNRRQGVEFEETYYYEDLFREFFVSNDNNELAKIYSSIEARRCYGKSFPQLKPKISQAVFGRPQLVQQDCRGFNIIRYGTKYYALASDIGPVDMATIEDEKLIEYQRAGKCFVERSPVGLKATLDYNIPELLYENCNGFNVVKYKNRFYAIAQSIGSVDITMLGDGKMDEYCKTGKCFVEDSFQKIRLVINRQPDGDKLDQRHAEIKQLQKEIDIGLEQIVKLKSEHKKALSELALRGKVITNLQDELENVRTQMEMTIVGLKNEFESIQSELALRDEKIISLKDNLKNIRTQTETTIAGLKNELESIQSELALRDEKIVSLKDNLKNIRTQTETTIAGLEQGYKHRCSEYEVLAKDFEKQSDYLQEVLSKCSRLESRGLRGIVSDKFKNRFSRKD
ncbi:MAG: putative sugar O-methyltransferase [Anaerohalosphaeraceae bacterium]|nr:putative sugar O-methyltransferase [Anaerohalosphaeraceae bacterium]